jgi:hypothetical protein
MIKWVIGMLATTALAFTVGCSGGETGSTQGLVRHLIMFRPREGIPPELLTEAEDAVRALPSRSQAINRLEWGTATANAIGCTHCFLLTFNDLQSHGDTPYREAISKASHGWVEPLVFPYLAQDATPHSRAGTRGHLRHVVVLDMKDAKVTAEDVKKLEDAIGALPSKIPTIERLEWGRWISGNPWDEYCFLFTFRDASARDEFLSHPAYQEFEKMMERYHYPGRGFFAVGYVARD